jgi:signal transduction histidine kinase
MQEILIKVLLYFSILLGVQKAPDNNANWIIEKNWVKEDYTWSFRANSSNATELCFNSENFLVFPQVIHGIHRVWADGTLIYQSGDTSFKQTSSFYERPAISCKFIANAKSISWEVVTYSQYFSRVFDFPAIKAQSSIYYLLDVITNVVACGGLCILALFSLFIFSGRVPKKYVFSLFVASIAFAGYAAFVTASTFGLKMEMLTAHKMADFCVWVGSLCYIYFFRSYNHLGKVAYYSYICAFVAGEFLIIFGQNADIVQLGTTIPIPFAFICLISFLMHSIHDGIQNGFNKYKLLGIFSSTLFVIAGINDLLHITGLIDSFMVMPLGSVGGVFFLAAAVNQNIERTYAERNDLVSNLQVKVEEQTKHLTLALEQVKKSQADLVQSARLASLGTLSAGIAHEINNSINFVSGAVVPLERRVLKHIPDDEKAVVSKLFDSIKQGTNLTVDIVRSLRNFTGLNQAKVKDVYLKSMVESVLTILKSKIGQINVIVSVPDDLSLTCYQVGLNQVLMNLVSNAIDAVPPENGSIYISAELAGENVVLKIADNGHGMSDETKSRMFDAFYTTKGVGKGSGLGLHIVFKEIEKHGGTITVNSALGKGTEFSIFVPRFLSGITEAA